MASASVNIRYYQVDNLALAMREVFASDEPVLCQIAVQFSVAGHPESENAFKVELALRFHEEGLGRPANLPYDTSIALQGLFDTPVKVLPNAVPASLVLNALMILYGIARGYIGTVTATCEHGPFVIPAVVFDGMVERAALTGGSNVVPIPESIRPADPAAINVFRFLFAIEDLPRYAALIKDDAPRFALLRGMSAFVDALNRLPASNGKSLDDAVRALEQIKMVTAQLAPPESFVLNAQIAYMAEGLQRAIASTHSSSSAEARISGSFAPAELSPGSAKKRKKKR